MVPFLSSSEYSSILNASVNLCFSLLVLYPEVLPLLAVLALLGQVVPVGVPLGPLQGRGDRNYGSKLEKGSL